LFVVVLLVEGAARVGYRSVRDPGSSLALGPFGWVQSLLFVVTGLLILAGAIGVRRALRPGAASAWGAALIGVWALGLIGAGLFVTDPVPGYPPGTPAVVEPTAHGSAHDLFSLAGFAALFVAFLVLSRGWRIYSGLTAVVFLGAFVLATLGFGQVAALAPIGGLMQRVAIGAGFLWLTRLAVRLRRRTRH
jgi:hypothetical membrane protein